MMTMVVKGGYEWLRVVVGWLWVVTIGYGWLRVVAGGYGRLLGGNL